MKLKLSLLICLSLGLKSLAYTDSSKFHFERSGLMVNVFSWIGAGFDFPVDGRLSTEIYFRKYGISNSIIGNNSGSNFRLNLKWHLNTGKSKRKSTNYLLTGIDFKTRSESGYFQQNQYTYNHSQMILGVLGIGRRMKRIELWVAAEPAMVVIENWSQSGNYAGYTYPTGYRPYPTFYVSAGLGLYLVRFRY